MMRLMRQPFVRQHLPASRFSSLPLAIARLSANTRRPRESIELHHIAQRVYVWPQNRMPLGKCLVVRTIDMPFGPSQVCKSSDIQGTNLSNASVTAGFGVPALAREALERGNISEFSSAVAA